MLGKPIPAFYCCYLLRSSRRSACVYVGSTPNPVRRTAQHNGKGKGGAVRANKEHLRPWEMAVIVTGFPSNIAALQFEWAWHNPHVTKKIPDDQRITHAVEEKWTSPSSGKPRKKTKRPNMSLAVHIHNLHLLLRVPGFSRWPLQVRCFHEDVYQKWQNWEKKIGSPVSSRINVLLDFERPEAVDGVDDVPASNQAKGKRKRENLGKGSPAGIDVGYRGLKSHVEKSMLLLANLENVQCAVCENDFASGLKTTLTCSHEGCTAACHMTCLAHSFLHEEGQQASPVPTTGRCPGCQKDLLWIDLVKEMSLRARGGKDVAQLMKKPKSRNAKDTKSFVKAMNSEVTMDCIDKANGAEIDDGMVDDALNVGVSPDDDLPDDWHYQDDDDDMISVTTSASVHSDTGDFTSSFKAASRPKLGAVIEDSEWDEADILD